MNVSILVITPTLGVSPFLDETIQSVARFAGRASHVIVAPQAAVCGLEARYPGLVVITEGDPGGGIYGALAKAISSLGSGFDWFTWINDDDRLEPGFSVVNAAAEIATGVDVIYANVRFIDKNGMYVSDVPVARSARLVRACVETGQIPFTQQGGLIRTSSYFRAGGFSADRPRRQDAPCGPPGGELSPSQGPAIWKHRVAARRARFDPGKIRGKEERAKEIACEGHLGTDASDGKNQKNQEVRFPQHEESHGRGG